MTAKISMSDMKAFAKHIYTEITGNIPEEKEILTFVQSFIDKQPKIPSEGEGVVVILNYTPKTHAIFGFDTKTIKDELMALNSEGKKDVVSYNGKLAYGPGWVITNKTKLKIVLDFLDENSISHTEIEKSEYETSPENKPKTKESPDLNELTLAQLKVIAKAEKLAVTGTKDELVERIETSRAGDADITKGNTISQSEVAEGEVPGKELTKLKLSELKDALKEKGLSTTGAKEVLIGRLLAQTKGNPATPAKSKKVVVKKPVTKSSEPKKTAAKPVAKTTVKTPKESKNTKTAAKKPVTKSSAAVLKPAKAKMNEYGNTVHEETGFVFIHAPVGEAGRNIPIVIGVQNTESKEKGFASVLPLDEEAISTAKENKFRYLNDEMMVVIKKKNPELHAELSTAFYSENEVENDGDVTEDEE